MHLQKPKKNLFLASETASGSFFSYFIYLMIFFGHFSAHFPQFVHFSESMCAMLPTTCTCIRFTYFFTHLTSDTSYGTYAHNVFSFILLSCTVRDASVHKVQARSDVLDRWRYFTTGFTRFFVNYCNSVYDMDRSNGTCLYAASETKTSERTSFLVRPFCIMAAIWQSVIPV